MIKIKKSNIHQAVAESLNKKGILPFSAREWNVLNVQQVVYWNTRNKEQGYVRYPEVMREVQIIAKQMHDEKSGQVEQLN
jgi:formaldehyde-activating enzyme involved in methanogenesis